MYAKQLREGIIIGVLLLAVLWLLSLIWGLVGKAQLAISQAHDTESQYQALEKRKATLEASLSSLETARGQDAAIRTAFGVARPGEEVIVVVPPADQASTSTPSWWQRLWSWF